ncbi:Protein BUNDLE SHEATH DEFECTIVE 2 chloroplastic [Euphorbia peplus]|nr:Protein BUNDLE SHEATH DEFECTIVE 2 chloroplastic [Euphorbia peplus]
MSSIYRHSSSKQENFGVHYFFPRNYTSRGCLVRTKAAQSNEKPKPKSVICDDCDGNGAVLCSQCKGGGVNSVDFFGGTFKAGASCWLCGGRKEMLCGNCNGAGFVGGFLSTQDE